MPNGRNVRKGGGLGFEESRWIWLFLIIVAVILFTGSGFFREGGIRFGSPSNEGRSGGESPENGVPSETGSLSPLPGQGGASEADSALAGTLTLSTGSAFAENPNEEYVEIFASSANEKKIVITGLRLENSRGESFAIGEGTYLPYSGQVNPEQAVALEAGGRAYVITGPSPIGSSFRLNSCTGYFAQFNSFEPRLREDCPRPEDESNTGGLSSSCLDFIETLPSCRQVVEVPEVDNECRVWVSSEINYSKCVGRHKPDQDYYKNERYVYIKRSSELWKTRRETITLRDQQGKIVDSVSY
mgnify:CR=1 FL=1